MARWLPPTLLLGALLALIVVPVGTGFSQNPKKFPPVPVVERADFVTTTAAKPTSIYKVYPLGKWQTNADFGNWLAETIPQMISPGTWNAENAPGKLSYYAPGQVLVISHNAEVHKKVSSFLKEIQGAIPTNQNTPTMTGFATGTPNGNPVVPAGFTVPKLLQMVSRPTATSRPTQPPQPTCVPYSPAHAQRPKHRFQFNITYEGEGLVDDNVVNMIRSQVQGESAPANVCCPPGCCRSGPGPVTTLVQPAQPVHSAPVYAAPNAPPQPPQPTQPVEAQNPWRQPAQPQAPTPPDTPNTAPAPSATVLPAPAVQAVPAQPEPQPKPEEVPPEESKPESDDPVGN